MRVAPSETARSLVTRAYDLHVHVSPDLIPRRIDDLTLAGRFEAVGLAGFVVKSHYQVTAERAAVVARAVPGVDVLGAITLNSAVGGLSALAVEIAARAGARFLWMPTFDAANETAGRGASEPDATLPVSARSPIGARCSNAASRPPIPAASRGSDCSRASAPAARNAHSSRAISGRSATPRSRTAWRCSPTVFWARASPRTRCTRWPSPTRAGSPAQTPRRELHRCRSARG